MLMLCDYLIMFGVKIGQVPVWRQYFTVIVANLSCFQFGISMGWISPAVIRLREVNQTTLPHPLTETETAWVMSLSSLFSLTACFYIGYIADAFGRKYSILLAVVPRIVCSFLQLFASTVWMLYVGRAICGLSDFSVMALVAMYTSEIASKEVRGGLGTVSQMAVAIGSMMLLSIGPFVSYSSINIIQTSLMVVTFVPLLYLPESPYFLYSKGKTDEAIKILTYLRGTDTAAHEELKDYGSTKTEKAAIKDLLTDPVLLKTIGIVLSLAVGSQMTGYIAVTYHLQMIFASTGTTMSPQISSVIIGCIQVFACICTILLTDRFGRKPVLGSTLFCLAVGLIGLGTFFKILDDGGEISGFLNYLPLMSMVLVVFCYNAGMGALVLIQIAELLDGPYRAHGLTGAAFAAAIFSFLSIRYFASLTAVVGPSAVYWIFSSCCIACWLFVVLVVPETKGKTFTQIQRDLGGK